MAGVRGGVGRGTDAEKEEKWTEGVWAHDRKGRCCCRERKRGEGKMDGFMTAMRAQSASGRNG